MLAHVVVPLEVNGTAAKPLEALRLPHNFESWGQFYTAFEATTAARWSFLLDAQLDPGKSSWTARGGRQAGVYTLCVRDGRGGFAVNGLSAVTHSIPLH